MRRNKTRFLCFILLLVVGSLQPGWTQVPVPDIKINNRDGPVTLSKTDQLALTVALDNQEMRNDADWWLAVMSPAGFFFVTPEGLLPTMKPIVQFPLFFLPPIDLISLQLIDFPLEEGPYVFYFGVDTNQDGLVSWQNLRFDSVVLNIIPTADLIPLAQVPQDVHRRAAQLLEEMRGSGMANGWENARLATRIRPFYRPDIEGIAYYELEVEPAGFIMVSAGRHDFPIPHWNFEGKSIGRELEEGAAELGKVASKLFKLDALSYAAEDPKEELAATLGTPISRLTGMSSSWLDLTEPPHIMTTAEPKTVLESDDEFSPIEFNVVQTGPAPPTIQVEAWDTWSTLKAQYLESYGVLVEGLRRRAAPDWETETAALEFGEGLSVGETYPLALLYSDARWTASGEGAEFVSFRLKERDGLLPVLEIRPQSLAPLGKEAFAVSLAYEQEGLNEELRFFIVNPEQEEGQQAVQSFEEATPLDSPNKQAASDWGPWTFYWAGTGNDQRMYHQFKLSTAQIFPSLALVSNCPSGCGPTAWAMLFGWGDHQAALGSATWWKRTGLYYQNGGKWPDPDADAPRNQDQGIEKITKEIHDYVSATCWAGWGGPQTATLPWEMDEAYKYFSGRTATTLKTDYSWCGISWDSFREKARNAIRDRKTPAVIGTGWLSHYPMAFGYAWRSRKTWACWICPWKSTEYNRWFYVNQGHGGSGDGWVSADTWFVGEIFP